MDGVRYRAPHCANNSTLRVGANNSTDMKNLKQPRNEIDFGGEEVALLPSLPFSLTDTCQSYI